MVFVFLVDLTVFVTLKCGQVFFELVFQVHGKIGCGVQSILMSAIYPWNYFMDFIQRKCTHMFPLFNIMEIFFNELMQSFVIIKINVLLFFKMVEM